MQLIGVQLGHNVLLWYSRQLSDASRVSMNSDDRSEMLRLDMVGDWSTRKAKGYLEIVFLDEQNFIDWTRSTTLVSRQNIVMR